MNDRDMASAVAQVLETGQARTLTEEEARDFHAAFRDAVGPEIDSYRESQRRAYEDVKELALR